MPRENLIKARKSLGLKQQNMAEKLGISIRHYFYIEAGKRTGNYKIWDQLEKLTKTSQSQLREIVETRLGQEDSQ